MITEKRILDALKNIIDPDFKKDIVSLGFVKNIRILEREVSFDIELTTPACPIKAQFKKAAEEAVKSLEEVEEVEVTMTSSKKPMPSQHKDSGLKNVKTILAVSSCKGGVGKSTVAGHLAVEIAGRGFKVGLLDADLFGPSVPILFDILNTKVHTTNNKKILPVEKNNLKLMSFGFLLGDSPAVMRGPMVSSYTQQILHNVVWGELDYLLIDFPPGTGDIQLTITQSAKLDGAVIVTTPHPLALADVTKGILMFEKVNVPILGVIENMSYFECNNCKQKHFIFGSNSNTKLADRFGIETLVQLPLHQDFTSKIIKPEESDLIKIAADKVIMAIGKSSIKTATPEVSFDDKEMVFKWPDGKTSAISNFDLRFSCKCALCHDEMSGKKTLKKEDIPADIRAKEITPLGNYAIAINWSDGHNSGIYSYKNIASIMV